CSSRRRHTRSKRDWSSDVCSSDLDLQVNFSAYGGISQATNVPDMMNAQELISYTQDSRNNALRQDYPSVSFNPETNEGRIDPNRSEERRVGKECSANCAPSHSR